jgi:hypothetical protein
MKETILWGVGGLVVGVVFAFIMRPSVPIVSSGTVPTPTSPATSGGATAAPPSVTISNLSSLF